MGHFYPPTKSRYALLHAISWTIFFLLQAACQSWHQSHPHENIRLMFILEGRIEIEESGFTCCKVLHRMWWIVRKPRGDGTVFRLTKFELPISDFDFKRSFGLFCCVSSSRSCYVLLRFRLLSKVIPSWIHFRLQTSNCFRLQTYRVDFRLKIWDLWYQREELIQQHARIASEVRNHQRMLSEVWSLKSLLGLRIIDIIFLSVKYCFWYKEAQNSIA